MRALPPEFAQALRELGLVGDEPLSGEPVTGGVASDIGRIDTPLGRWAWSAPSARWPRCAWWRIGARPSSATGTRQAGCRWRRRRPQIFGGGAHAGRRVDIQDFKIERLGTTARFAGTGVFGRNPTRPRLTA